jgi:hypothetical protein
MVKPLGQALQCDLPEQLKVQLHRQHGQRIQALDHLRL